MAAAKLNTFFINFKNLTVFVRQTICRVAPLGFLKDGWPHI